MTNVSAPRHRGPARVEGEVRLSAQISSHSQTALAFCVVMAWHLLAPPAAWDTREHRMRWVSDAPLVEWYHEGEFKTFGDCHKAREAKIVKIQNRLAEDGDNAAGSVSTDLERLRYARCLSDDQVR